LLGELVQRVLGEWATEHGWTEVPACFLERPADDSHGDYATPVCMQTAKTAKQSPRALAEELRERLLADPHVARLVDDIQVAGPGFINFTLSVEAYVDVMREMLVRGEAIGSGSRHETPRINLEFVSVNPNGPLHVGHGRYAAYGDALKRLLLFSGANIATEFYINDYGRWIGSAVVSQRAMRSCSTWIYRCRRTDIRVTMWLESPPTLGIRWAIAIWRLSSWR
jgi:arginyl-tRNA synthetase